ncbi:MAG: biotin--[acetyl-CoA-carboxylase] ligase [Acidimicrobiales bacterium]
MTGEHRAAGSAQEASVEQATRQALRRLITPERLGAIDSTNRYLADLARQGAPEGTAVLADSQTAGRGRLGRRWVDAGGGSVLCSVLLRPRVEVLPVERWHLLSWAVALAGADACVDASGMDVQSVEVRFKWPNDLVIGERKVAGVLAEVVPPGLGPAGAEGGPRTAGTDADALPAVVVGIGINCNWPPSWPPPGDPDASAITARAVSLDRVAGRAVDRDAVAARLLEQVANRYGRLCAPLPSSSAAALASEYRRRSATIGREVRIDLEGETFSGTAMDVDDGGRLLVNVGACTRVVEAGDVVHLR